jgi:glycosyltransferase involved in cell wall biosynthesis
VRIILLVTSAPGTRWCGVCDYTERLCNAINAKGCEAYIEKLPSWSFSATTLLKRKHPPQTETVFHLQYPSSVCVVGMGHSIVPAFSPIIFHPSPVYLTLHEFSWFGLLRKLSFLSHVLLSKGILFSNELEYDNFGGFFRVTIAKRYIVPIGSNIVEPHTSSAPMAKNRIIYFGIIDEGKGIELFLEIIRELRQRMSTFDAAIIGAVVNRDSVLFKEVQEYSGFYDIDLLLDMDEERVSHELKTSTVALLPFPDGISEKRSSALACLQHGNVVVTKHSEKTPLWMKNGTYHFSSINHASQIIMSILQTKGKSARELDLSVLMEEIGKRQWPRIAEEHIRIYRLQRRRAKGARSVSSLS